MVERANRSLGEGIKARLDERIKKLIEEISHVLWAHHTMIKSNNGDTSFALTYGTEVVISAEIGMPTLRTAKVNMAQNDEALEISLDLLEERREQAAIREARSKAKMEKYYNSQHKLQARRSYVPQQRGQPCGRRWKAWTELGRTVRSYGCTWQGRIQAQRP
ncbi:reverse transcriptase domain-containing protein [Tanacetum coccineum]